MFEQDRADISHFDFFDLLILSVLSVLLLKVEELILSGGLCEGEFPCGYVLVYYSFESLFCSFNVNFVVYCVVFAKLYGELDAASTELLISSDVVVQHKLVASD